MYSKTIDKNLIRHDQTQALLNTDNHALAEYKIKKKARKDQSKRLNRLEEQSQLFEKRLEMIELKLTQDG